MELKTICTQCKDKRTWYVRAGFPLSEEPCENCGRQGTLVALKGD